MRLRILSMAYFLVLLASSSLVGDTFDAGFVSNMIEGGNIGAARRVLDARLEEHPDDFLAWRLYGRLYEVIGPAGKAASAYAQALALKPEDIPSFQGLGRLLASSPPGWLEESALKILPAELERAEITFASHLEKKSCNWRLLQVLPKMPVAEARDPKHKWPFPFLRYGYVYQDRQERWEHKFTVRWSHDRHTDLARNILDLLLRLHALTKEHLGREPMFGREGRITVWICPAGEAGGEQWKDNLYLYEVDTPRPATEWLREVSHEYGHHVLPAAGGFTEPEGWASGFLGERLLMRWLLDASLKGPLWPGDNEAESYLKSSIGPVIKLFMREGPRSPLLRGTSKQAMDVYIGLVLTAHAIYGTKTLREAFDTQKSPAPRRFLDALERVVDARSPKAIRLPLEMAFKRGNPNKRRFTYHLYLPGGKYRLIPDPKPQVKAAGTVALNGGKPLDWNRPLTVSAGWHRIEITTTPGDKAMVKGFVLLR